MTALLSPTATAAAQPGAAAPQRPLALLGGVALLLAAPLLTAGAVTSPPQDSAAPADYIASLARDPFLSSASATLLHYGWVALAFGLLAAIGLVRGRRGRGLALVGGITGAFGAMQVSGLVLNDWFLISLGRNVDPATAVTVFTSMGDASVSFWLACSKVAPFLPVLLWAGLARAGVISWWLVPLGLFWMIAPFVLAAALPGTLGLVLAAVSGLVCSAPALVTGARLLGRGRLARA